jgi:hypothetical protein
LPVRIYAVKPWGHKGNLEGRFQTVTEAKRYLESLEYEEDKNAKIEACP